MGTLSYFNAGMGPHNRAAMASLGSTGHLPQDTYWDAMRVRHDANPSRFEAGHRVMGALLGRDRAQRMGEADGGTSLFPHTPLWAHLRGRHEAHTARFDRHHPFLGKLFKLKLTHGSSAGMPTTGLVVGADAPGRASSLAASDVPISSGAPDFDVPISRMTGGASSLTASDVPIPSGDPVFEPPISSGAPLFDVPTSSGAPLFDVPVPRVETTTNSQEVSHPAVAPVPEPSGITLAGLGLVLVFLAGARSRWARTG